MDDHLVAALEDEDDGLEQARLGVEPLDVLRRTQQARTGLADDATTAAGLADGATTAADELRDASC